jgi:hypothetical protein
VIIALLIIGGGIYILVKNNFFNSDTTITTTPTNAVVCTKDAKLCPDGSSVVRTGPNCEFVCPPGGTPEIKTEFNKLITMHVNDKIIFSNGLSLILEDINDSRCKPGLECVWQGELSGLFDINIKNSLEEIRLGTVNSKKVTFKGYTFSLKSATENSMTIMVSIN